MLLPQTDSPVFLFLPQLLNSDAAPPAAPTAAPADTKSFADLMETFKQAKKGVKRPDDWRGVLVVKPVMLADFLSQLGDFFLSFLLRRCHAA